MTNLKKIATLSFGVAFLYSAEISVFDAGNLDSTNPYGLTDSEKVLLKNKQRVENLSRNMGDVESSLSGAQERIEGLQSIMDGINERISRLEKRINDLEAQALNKEDSLKNELETLKKYSEETRTIQETNNKKITKTLKDLGTLIDKSNAAKEESKSTKNKSEESNKQTSADFTKQKIQDVAADAKKLFDEGKLDEAKDRYEFLITKGHKPAAANFYLGEISYKQKAYNNAIKYYQQSIALYDKADYIPKLLYHTAISFDKINDTQSANRFYKALKLGYPESKEAKASPDR